MVVHVLDDEALIYDPRTADTHRLNETAMFVWKQCDGVQTNDDIAVRISDVYDVTQNEALEHVNRVLDEFSQRGLLEKF
ncbi:MAG: HPr-rel-A system PqqD family peptide chaperone [Planctomycetota bacterium]